MSVHKHQRMMQQVEAERDAARAEVVPKAADCIDVVAASERLGEFAGDTERPLEYQSEYHCSKN
ncbi:MULTISPECIES: hypothetical protein [Adlercreutzia]|uniref:hypothetical protein n=2 Tax=Adlercreutzia TaxID=447020 RepID=UPI00272B7A0C|nr:hypothetical protein [Adlercreutzia caecimuris]